ncbi:MAG: YdeI/OmpD-associated family protein [Opitutales bacterium]
MRPASDPDTYFTHRFNGRIARHDFGRFAYTVMYLPAEMEPELPFARFPRLRVDAMIDGIPFHDAWQPYSGRRFLILSKAVLRRGRWEFGDPVTVRFCVVDQNAVEVPVELQLALDRSEGARRFREALTPGKRRGLAHRVSSAKTEATRLKRVAEVLESLQ